VANPGTGWGGTDIADPLSILEPWDADDAWPGQRLLMVSTTGEHAAWFELDAALQPQPAAMPAAVQAIVDRIGENCEPALCTVLFLAGAGGSLRAGVTDNPVRLTQAIKQSLVNVTCGGAPAYVWPGGGITVMVDVLRMPAHSFGTVPTPAIVAPIEFSMRLDDYRRLGGHMAYVRTLGAGPGHWRLARRWRADGAAHRRCGARQSLAAGSATVAGLMPMWAAQRAPLPGGRWHLQHGPIDIVIAAEGDADAVAAAHAAAWVRFQPLLGDLVAELPRLRQPVDAAGNPLRGLVARRMWAACAPLRAAAGGFLTPMAAVAGAVAQELIAAYQRPGITRAWVNNGGDIALHLAPGQSARVGLMADLSRFDAEALARTVAGNLRTDAGFTVAHASPVRGVATSGWRGRSHSLGIADSVTVLAASAAQADAAATVVANAVNRRRRPHPARTCQQPARRQRPGRAPRHRGGAAAAACGGAAGAGCRPAAARQLQARGCIHAALLVCQGSLARLAPLGALELV
jgi:ApbE superfamily uncharacterized protein (UPF0280 family)